MSAPLIIKNNIIINAPVSKVWDALTNPEQTKKYMHGCAAVSDWKPGSPLLWCSMWEGEEKAFVKGEIVAIEPEIHLAYTTIDPNGSIEDIPANYATVTYTLAEHNGQTLLYVTQGDFANITNGKKRFNDTMSQGGWQSILTQIKNLVE